MKAAVAFTVLAAFAYLFFPPAGDPTISPQSARAELFAAETDPVSAYQLGDDGPIIIPAAPDEGHVSGGPVLLTAPGTIGAAPAVVFGRPKDIDPHVQATEGFRFSVIQSGGHIIPFTVSAVETAEKGDPLPVSVGDDDLVLVSCVEGCRRLQLVRATPGDLPSKGTFVGNTPASSWRLPVPPTSSGLGAVVVPGALVVAAIAVSTFAVRRWWLWVSVPGAVAIVVVAGHVAAGIVERAGSWAV